MNDRRWLSRKVTLFIAITAATLTLPLGAAYISRRDARTAAHLLQISEEVTLGHTTRDQFLSLAEPYRDHLLRVGTAKSAETSSVMIYKFHGHFRTPVVMTISISFSGDIVVGRDVGLLRGDCCSIETRQRLESPMDSLFGSHRVLREIVGDPRFVKFEVAPGIYGQPLSDIFDYRTECLLPFNNCDSIDKLNPHAVNLLRESINAGY